LLSIAAKFCSEECEDAAQHFHRYECGFLDVLDTLPATLSNIQMALRTFFEVLHHSSNSFEKMMTMVSIAKLNSTRISDICDVDLLKICSIIGLTGAIDREKYGRLVEEVLMILPSMKFALKNLKLREFAVDFMLRLMTIEFMIQDPSPEACEPLAGGINFLFANMRHSCASNVYGICKDGKMVYRAKEPIEKGTELTYNHLVDYETFALQERRNLIHKTLGIVCQCRACSHNFPLFNQLPCYDITFIVSDNSINEALEFDKHQAEKEFIRNSTFIDKHFGLFPCKEISILQKCNIICLEKLTK